MKPAVVKVRGVDLSRCGQDRPQILLAPEAAVWQSFSGFDYRTDQDTHNILGQQTLANPGRMQEVVLEHMLILEAIKAGDRRRAQEAVDHHLKITEDRLLERLEKG